MRERKGFRRSGSDDSRSPLPTPPPRSSDLLLPMPRRRRHHRRRPAYLDPPVPQRPRGGMAEQQVTQTTTTVPQAPTTAPQAPTTPPRLLRDSSSDDSDSSSSSSDEGLSALGKPERKGKKKAKKSRELGIGLGGLGQTYQRTKGSKKEKKPPINKPESFEGELDPSPAYRPLNFRTWHE